MQYIFILLPAVIYSQQNNNSGFVNGINRNVVTTSSYTPCTDEETDIRCTKGGTKFCEIIGSDPGFRCVCKPGFEGPSCSNFDYELKCDQSHITVKAKKSYFDDMEVSNFKDLHLNDNECFAAEEEDPRDGTRYYKWSITGSPRNCKSVVSKNATHLMYSNAIRDADTTADSKLVTRSRIEIQFHCTFPVNYRLSLNKDLKPKVKTISFATERGQFSVDFKVYQDQQFTREWRPSVEEGPIEVGKGQRIYIQLGLTTILADLASKLVVDECWGTPSEAPIQTIVQNLIQTGCPMDNTVKVYTNGDSRYVRFEFQMFAFQNLDADVHLHCVVRVCGDECKMNCPRGGRKRRAVDEDFALEISEETVHLITSPSLRVRLPGQATQQEGKISRDKLELEKKHLPAGVSEAILIVLVIVLVLVVCAIVIGIYMMIQKKRTALADQILEDSAKPKVSPQSAAGTSFSIFFG